MAVQIATGITTTGTTTAVPVPEVRCYSIQVTWDMGSATAVPEFSVDGVNFFNVISATLVNRSNTGNIRSYAVLDMPVTMMRLNVTGISGGATVSASVSPV